MVWSGSSASPFFGRLDGYDDVNDADRLGRDPAMRWIVGDHAIKGRAASTSQMGRFETELPAGDENFASLAKVAVPRGLFRKILSLIDDLRPRPAPA